MSTDSNVRWLHVDLWLGLASHSEASGPESFWGFSCLCLPPSSPCERLDHRDVFLWLHGVSSGVQTQGLMLVQQWFHPMNELPAVSANVNAGGPWRNYLP